MPRKKKEEPVKPKRKYKPRVKPWAIVIEACSKLEPGSYRLSSTAPGMFCFKHGDVIVEGSSQKKADCIRLVKAIDGILSK